MRRTSSADSIEDLDRLHHLKAARGAVPPRGPSVAVAVVQTGPEAAVGNKMGSFGSFDVEAAERLMGSFGSFSC